MDAPESSNSQTNDEAAFVEYASQDAAPMWPETHTHVAHPSLYGAIPTATPNPALPVNDIFGVSLGQITDEEALLLWQQMEIEYSTSMQLATAGGPPIPPTVDPSTALIGQGQIFNTDFGASTTHPSVFGYQEAPSWPNPSNLASPPTSAIWYPDYSYAQPPMEPLSSHHFGAFGALGDVQFTNTPIAPLPPPLRPAKPIKKRQRAKPGNTCQGCRLRHKRCRRDSSCLELAVKFYDPGVRGQISTKLEIVEMIEVGSYFSNWGYTPSCEIFSGYEWQTFHEVFNVLQLKNDEVYVTLTAAVSNIDCVIPLGMVYSCFEALSKEGTRSATSTPSEVLRTIKELARLHPYTQFVHLHQPACDREKSYISWTSAISFCSQNSYIWGLLDKLPGSSSDEYKERLHEMFMSTREKFKKASLQGQKQTSEESADVSDHLDHRISDAFQEVKDELRAAELCKHLKVGSLTAIRKPITNDVSFQLSWIVSRYLEFCIFGYIQKYFNSREKRTQAGIRFFVALTLSILTIVERPLPTSEQLESGGLSVAIKDFIDRQDKIRSALWMCCSVMASKLDPFQDPESEFYRYIPPLSANGLPNPVWASLASFDQQTMESEQELYWSAQPFHFERSAVAGGLDAMKQYVVASESSGSEDAFRWLFQDVASGFLDDLTLESPDASPQLERLKAHRMFLGLASAGWTLEDVGGPGNLFLETDKRITKFASYLLHKMRTRERLARLYHGMLTFTNTPIARRSNFEIQLDRVDLQSHCDSDSVSHCLFLKACCIGRRWKQLQEIAGEAIILCGSSLVDHSSNWNIPKVVETGSQEQFESLCAALDGDMLWVKKVCGQLIGTLATLGDVDQSGRRRVVPENERLQHQQKALLDFYNQVRSVVGDVHPMTLFSGELRSIGLGKSAHDIIQQLQKDGQVASLGQRKLLQHCIDMIMQHVVSINPRSKAELARAKEHFVSQMLQIVSPQILAYLSPILDNLWF